MNREDSSRHTLGLCQMEYTCSLGMIDAIHSAMALWSFFSSICAFAGHGCTTVRRWESLRISGVAGRLTIVAGLKNERARERWRAWGKHRRCNVAKLIENSSLSGIGDASSGQGLCRAETEWRTASCSPAPAHDPRLGSHLHSSRTCIMSYGVSIIFVLALFRIF